MINDINSFNINSLVYYSYFVKNGYDKCGYILKPNILRRNFINKQDFYYLYITVISGY